MPFCVLDEVDAALDEANIGRSRTRSASRQGTQCIVITHNRGTIEAADALYGVTVGDDSASRVISLRLDEATALAGRSRSGRRGIADRRLRRGSSGRVTGPETRQRDLENGLRRSRGGFMARLRGLLVGEAIDPETWDEVEESLTLYGDVGAELSPPRSSTEPASGARPMAPQPRSDVS